MNKTAIDPASLPGRLWTYQAERFPLARTVPLLGAFSAASVTASARLAHRGLPGAANYLVAFLLVFTFFWQMRAMDEVKDAETDRLYRPERPIPRGLISLRLIVWLAALSSVPAGIAALVISPKLFCLVLVVWAWLALMTAEFFAPKLLHRSPALYLLSHMAIMPIIDLVLTGCEWAPVSGMPPAGLWTFLWMSFCNGCVVEFGRKIWAPEQEREGVDTYSSTWGIARSLIVLCLATSGAFLGLAACGFYLGRPIVTMLSGAVAFSCFGFVLFRFARLPTPNRQKWVETLSGLWVLACYLTAAFAPALEL